VWCARVAVRASVRVWRWDRDERVRGPCVGRSCDECASVDWIESGERGACVRGAQGRDGGELNCCHNPGRELVDAVFSQLLVNP
jgi:hypothetical protein